MAADGTNALNVNWAFGFSKNVVGGVQSLTTVNERNAIFFISAHSGVIYDYENRNQMILQGHCNCIVCCAVSKDKRWIVTGDLGEDAILVVWDSISGAPVKTYFSPHKKGILSVDISDDALFICTLGAVDNGRQEVAVWAWTKESDTPILCQNIISSESQNNIKFDRGKQSEFASTGNKTVCFWNWEGFNLEGYVGKVSKTDFGHYSGRFTYTLYLAGTETALTATEDGYVIVWETQYATVLLDDPGDRLMRTATKVIRLVECGISMMDIINGYVAVACLDGSIRFYDFSLRLEAWFEDMAAGPVTSVSFTIQSCPFPADEAGRPGLQFWVPDFIAGTAEAFIVGMESAVFQEVRVEDRRGTLLVQGMADDVSSLSCHPLKPLLAVGCYNGTLQVWDYEMKLLMNLREFSTKTGQISISSKKNSDGLGGGLLRPQCLSFDPSGEYLAVGFTSGHIKLLRTDTFEDVASFAPTPNTVVGLRFSPSALYLAAYDSGNHVLLFKRSSVGGGNDDESSETSLSLEGGDDLQNFVYIGRAKAHKAPITGVEFGLKEGREVLLSVAEDRRVVEFNLQISSVRLGLCTGDIPASIESTARSTAILWHPRIGEDIEDRFITVNDEFKFKEFNADSKQCRKTTLAPTFGGPPNKIVLMPPDASDETHSKTRYYAYSTAERVVGLGCLPLTGDPSKVMGLVAHPAKISGLAVSFDGLFLFTAGGSDLTVNMWTIDTSALSPALNISEFKELESIEPFLELLEGGSGGEMHNDIIEYFYFCQLRNQGENSMESRRITGKIPLEEVPSLMRAVGYYPTEEEVTNMINEVRYADFMITGETYTDIDLNGLIRLYLNHRPAVALNNTHIEAAFNQIAKSLNGPHSTDSAVSWQEMKRLLTSDGEAISLADLDVCMQALIGSNANVLDGQMITAARLAEEILGFDYSTSTEQES